MIDRVTRECRGMRRPAEIPISTIDPTCNAARAAVTISARVSVRAHVLFVFEFSYRSVYLTVAHEINGPVGDQLKFRSSGRAVHIDQTAQGGNTDRPIRSVARDASARLDTLKKLAFLLNTAGPQTSRNFYFILLITICVSGFANDMTN